MVVVVLVVLVVVLVVILIVSLVIVVVLAGFPGQAQFIRNEEMLYLSASCRLGQYMPLHFLYDSLQLTYQQVLLLYLRFLLSLVASQLIL